MSQFCCQYSVCIMKNKVVISNESNSLFFPTNNNINNKIPLYILMFKSSVIWSHQQKKPQVAKLETYQSAVTIFYDKEFHKGKHQVRCSSMVLYLRLFNVLMPGYFKKCVCVYTYIPNICKFCLGMSNICVVKINVWYLWGMGAAVAWASSTPLRMVKDTCQWTFVLWLLLRPVLPLLETEGCGKESKWPSWHNQIFQRYQAKHGESHICCLFFLPYKLSQKRAAFESHLVIPVLYLIWIVSSLVLQWHTQILKLDSEPLFMDCATSASRWIDCQMCLNYMWPFPFLNWTFPLYKS